MYGNEITELGQFTEQENMLERSQAQALRRARLHVAMQNGAGGPSTTLRRRVLAIFGVKASSPSASCLSGPQASHQSAGR